MPFEILMKTLLFAGHPGHELLAYKFLMEYKPHVIFLTTGSGNTDDPRINSSIQLIESLGLKVFRPFEPFTDRLLYNLVMNGGFQEFANVKSSLIAFIEQHDIELIVGDALEGFNPSHDLCRYIINASVQELPPEKKILNYDFLLDEVSRNQVSQKSDSDIVLKLDEEEMESKLNACRVYSRLKFEVDRFFEKYGSEFFSLEYFRKISNTLEISNWEEEAPFYETHGRKRVEEGVYESALLFESHMKPLANHLLNVK